jgi:hypothetical protein
MDLPLVAIDIPSGFDVLRAPHEIGGTIAVEPEQPHRAHSLTEVRAAMFHGGARPEGGWFGLRRVKAVEDKINGTASFLSSDCSGEEARRVVLNFGTWQGIMTELIEVITDQSMQQE